MNDVKKTHVSAKVYIVLIVIMKIWENFAPKESKETKEEKTFSASKDDEHDGDPPLPNEDADLKDCAVSAIMLCVVHSEGIHLGLLIPEIST